tara:strand:+ start:512 stop:883 length:372 start_codon:yes stop_codon:yes gene_type:complete
MLGNTAYQRIIINGYKLIILLPLENSTIIRLNEITTMISDKSKLSLDDESLIKKIFQELNQNGQLYDVDEIESWFENEGNWNSKNVRIRIVNIAHYAQTKFEQTNRFHMISDSCNDDSCSCGH